MKSLPKFSYPQFRGSICDAVGPHEGCPAFARAELLSPQQAPVISQMSRMPRSIRGGAAYLPRLARSTRTGVPVSGAKLLVRAHCRDCTSDRRYRRRSQPVFGSVSTFTISGCRAQIADQGPRRRRFSAYLGSFRRTADQPGPDAGRMTQWQNSRSPLD